MASETIKTSQLEMMGQLAKTAETQLSQLSNQVRNQGLKVMAEALMTHTEDILKANQIDLDNATDLKASFVDRLTLTVDRIKAMAEGMQQVPNYQTQLVAWTKCGKTMLG